MSTLTSIDFRTLEDEVARLDRSMRSRSGFLDADCATVTRRASGGRP
jgi:hypothetical protein